MKGNIWIMLVGAFLAWGTWEAAFAREGLQSALDDAIPSPPAELLLAGAAKPPEPDPGEAQSPPEAVRTPAPAPAPEVTQTAAERAPEDVREERQNPFSPIDRSLRMLNLKEEKQPETIPTPTPTPIPTPFTDVTLSSLIVSNQKTMAVFKIKDKSLLVHLGEYFPLEGSSKTFSIQFVDVGQKTVTLEDERGDQYEIRLEL